MIAIINKATAEVEIHSDISTASKYLGLSVYALKGRLPEYEDRDYIITVKVNIVRSARGKGQV